MCDKIKQISNIQIFQIKNKLFLLLFLLKKFKTHKVKLNF